MQSGPSALTRSEDSCCGSALSVVALTRDDGTKSLVELVRCTACGLSSWRLDGRDVGKDEALSALSAAFAPQTPAKPPRRVRPTKPASVAPAAPTSTDLADLLAGWQVHGTA